MPLNPAVARIASAYNERSGGKLPVHLMSSPAAAIAYAGAQAGWTRFHQWHKTRRTWTITIDGGDELFFDVQAWLMEHGAEKTRKALTAQTYYVPDPNAAPTPAMRLLADDDEPQDMEIGGHTITLSIAESGPMPPGQATSMKAPKLVLSAKSQQGRDAAIELLRGLREKRVKEKRQPGLMVLDKWGDWRRRADLPPRPMASVITKDDVHVALREDLEEFVRREKDYVRLAIPYHRAYLLVGPPGTGKTSAVKAVANALGLDLWYAQLSGIDKDAKLSDVFGDVRARGVLLLEDIDSLPAAIERTDDDKSEGDISTSGLLNALDGVATPHGLITIMTTNHPEHLDEALMRPGRVDRVLAFEHPDRKTMQRHFEFFYGRPTQVEFKAGRSSAAISEIFKRNMDDPAAAEAELLKPPSENEEKSWHPRVASFSGGGGGKTRAYQPTPG